MKVLIGTPIHESKDYSMERWLKNVSDLIKITPADILLVDNSSNPNYTKKVKGYLKKYRLKSKIRHTELSPKIEKFERIARSREVIRNEIINEGYDAWFCWECDQIIPADSLEKLIKIMEDGNYMLVNSNKWQREAPNQFNYDFGCALINRKALENYSFLIDFGTDPEMPDSYELSEYWFKTRIIRDGGKFVEVDGVIDPIYHLDI